MIYLNTGVYPLISFVLVLISLTKCDETTTSSPRDEPTFPDLLDPFSSGAVTTSIKIVTETTDGVDDYKVITEYLDTKLVSAAYVIRRKGEASYVLVDGSRNMTHSYKPYKCKIVDPGKLGSLTANGWSTKIDLPIRRTDDKTSRVQLELIGVIGYWLYVSREPKQYSHSQVIFSASKGRYLKSHKWYANDVNQGIRVEMYFVDVAPEGSPKPILSLEVVKVLILQQEKKIWSTYNVLSVDYGIEQEAYANIMQLPVGYGCLFDLQEVQFNELRSKEGRKIAIKHALNNRKLSLEVTSAEFLYVGGQATSRTSNTINVEVARRWDVYLMLRFQDTFSHTKHVIDYKNYVQYNVDMLKGTCKMSHYRYDLENMARPIEIKFNNGLSMKLTLETLVELFDSQEDFGLIKTTKQPLGVTDQVYFEKAGVFDVFDTGSPQPARIARKYISNDNEYTLQSVTIWIMNKDETRIDKLYDINVIDVQPVQDYWYALPKVYDVTRECYLENEQMKNGRDYVWLEFRYPIRDSEERAWMLDRTNVLQTALHKRFANYFEANSFRLPQLELRFEDDSFKARLLLLDYPPLEFMFAKLDATMIEFKPELDNEDATIDLTHCSQLCRLKQCHLMTFCESTRKCLYSSRTFGMKTQFVKHEQCETYMDTSHDHRNNLQFLIAKTQHLDYSPLSVYEPCEELVLPRSETGVSFAEYNELALEYRQNVTNHIRKQRSELAHLAIFVDFEGWPRVLVPTSFGVEVDPLKESGLIDSEDYDRKLPAFRTSLAMARYKPEVFDLTNERNARLYRHLTYDQCALACVDNGCGSFSYCLGKLECVITTLNLNISELRSPPLIDTTSTASDCIIKQRDFLSNFDAVEDTRPVRVYEKRSSAGSGSECAIMCLSETSFRCLAFDFCRVKDGSGVCLLQSTRHRTGVGTEPQQFQAETMNLSPTETKCTHFSRSYLADFADLPYRAFRDEVKTQLKTNIVSGKSIFECATSCMLELYDCVAFEFCFNVNSVGEQTPGALQRCELISGRVSQLKLVDLLASDDKGKSTDKMDVNRLLVNSENCHIYTLRRNSAEDQLRDLAISFEFDSGKLDANSSRASKAENLLLGIGVLLYIGVVLLSVATGTIFYLTKSNEFVTRKIERIRLVLGV